MNEEISLPVTTMNGNNAAVTADYDFTTVKKSETMKQMPSALLQSIRKNKPLRLR